MIESCGPRVSVIIPTYNCERFLGKAIRSALNQTYQDFEVIVVDDGSSDGTADVLRSFDGRIRHERQQRQGPSAARNRGISMSRGEYLAFLDADDCWDECFLEKQLRALDAHPDGCLSFCWGLKVDPRGSPYGSYLRPPTRGRKRSEVLTDLLQCRWFPFPSSVLARRRCVIAAGLFDLSLNSWEDWDLWIRMGGKWDFVEVPECLFYYMRHCTSSAARSLGRGVEAGTSVLDRVFSSRDLPFQPDDSLKNRAYARVYWSIAWAHYAVEDIEPGQRWLRRAVSVSPEAFQPPFGSLIEKIAGEGDDLYGPCTTLEQTSGALERFFDQLPEAATHLTRIRRQTLGFASAANLFRNSGLQRWAEVRRAALRAIWYRPAWLLNRGFLSIWLRSFVPVLRRVPDRVLVD